MTFRYKLPNSLKRCVNKTITVKIKIYGHFIRGKLIEFDQHLNLIMDDAEEITKIKQTKKIKKLNNRIIIRGDSIIYVDFMGSINPITT